MSVTAPQNGLSPYWEVENNPWIRRGNDSSPNHQNSLVNPRDYEMQVLLCRNCQQSACTQPSASLSTNKNRSHMTLTMELKEHFLRFCETTSLRGVPRIVKTKEKKKKLLWIFFVLIFFIGCITCVVIIVSQYLRADVIHQPVTLTHKPRSFPSLTICNTRPISVRGYNILKGNQLMDKVEYSQALMKKLIELNKKLNFSSEERSYLTMSLSTAAYLQALPEHISSESLGHARDEMILDCQAVVVEGNFNIIRQCFNIGNWTPIFNEGFLNCYTFTVTSTAYSRGTKNINLMVFLGERTPSCGDCSSTPETQVDGVRVQLHETNTYPNVNEGGVYLSPGTLTEIQFVTKEWKMMQPPHGICNKNQQKEIRLNDTNFRFTSSACGMVEIQKKIAEECNCTVFENPVIPQYKHLRDHKQYCRIPLMSVHRNMTNSIELSNHYVREKYIKVIKCSVTVKKRYQSVDLGCFSPCRYYTYDSSTSSTRWPTRAFFEDFFKKMLKLKKIRIGQLCISYLKIKTKGKLNPYMRRKIYTECLKKVRKDKKNPEATHILQIESLYNDIMSKRGLLRHKGDEIDKLMKRMLLKEYINNHFLTIQVSRANFDIISIEEKAVISLTSLFSQVGGLLSIWVGLTFVCIVEIIEFCFNVFETVSNKKK